MSELLGENKELAVREFEILRGDCGCGRRFAVDHLRPGRHRFDPDWDAMLLLDLADRDGPIRNVQDTFDEAALGITRAIRKLRHQVKFTQSVTRRIPAVQLRRRATKNF